jgi:hypothetical protein
VSTCGGILWAYDAKRDHSGTRDLITGDEIEVPPYKWFRCSSDRKVVVGIIGNADDLYKGASPATKVARAEKPYFWTFDVSPGGSKVAYTSHSRGLCVFSSSGPAQCTADDSIVAFADGLSVNDSGEVLVATDTPQECFYKTPSNFSSTPISGASRDACLGIGYWKPGLKSIEILEPIGRNPQWISPATAGLLRDWTARSPEGGGKP